jgi:hypothetical protein
MEVQTYLQKKAVCRTAWERLRATFIMPLFRVIFFRSPHKRTTGQR